MPSALRIAKLIHDAMTIASMNAWHYWWVYPAGADNGALWDFNTKQATKRLWVEGNFARFVRPGFVRVGTTGTAPSGVLLSAYTNPADGTVAVVAINNNTSATPLSLFVSGAAPCSLTPWVTSATDTLAAKTTAVGVELARVGHARRPERHDPGGEAMIHIDRRIAGAAAAAFLFAACAGSEAPDNGAGGATSGSVGGAVGSGGSSSGAGGALGAAARPAAAAQPEAAAIVGPVARRARAVAWAPADGPWASAAPPGRAAL